MTWTAGAGITDLAGNAITTPASLHRDRLGRGLLMAAARSRLAIALAALGIAFAACFGGDHGAARAAVGNATGPLIGSPLAGAAILDGQRPGARRRAHGLHHVTNIGDASGDLRPRGDRADSDARWRSKLDLDVARRHPGARRHGRLLRQAGVAVERRAGRHGPGRGAPLPLQRQPPGRRRRQLSGRLERGHLPVVGHRRPSPPRRPRRRRPPRRPRRAPATTPARATTAEAPPKATTAGGTRQARRDRHRAGAPEGQDRQGHRHRHLRRRLPRSPLSGTAVVGSAKRQAQAGHAHADARPSALRMHGRRSRARRGWRWPPGAPSPSA